MSMEKLFHLPDGTPCNAAETVCRMLGAAPGVSGTCGEGGLLCRALQAALALTPEPERAELLRDMDGHGLSEQTAEKAALTVRSVLIRDGGDAAIHIQLAPL